jgi:hypothetical protein
LRFAASVSRETQAAKRKQLRSQCSKRRII